MSKIKTIIIISFTLIFASCTLNKVKFKKIIGDIYIQKSKNHECVVIKRDNIKPYDKSYCLIKKDTKNDSIVRIKIIDSITINNMRFICSDAIVFKGWYRNRNQEREINDSGIIASFYDLKEKDSIIEFKTNDTVVVLLMIKDFYLDTAKYFVFAGPLLKVIIADNGDYELYLLPHLTPAEGNVSD